MRRVLITSAMLALATPAGAQGMPVPVEQMTCEQLLAEMETSNDQLEAANGAFAISDEEAAAQEKAAMAGAGKDIAMGLACAVPGVGMACMVMQGAQGLAAGAQMQQSMQQHQRMMEQHQQAMARIDMARMQAVTKRVQEKCLGAP